MKQFSTLTVSLLLFITFSCKKEEAGLLWLSIPETQCANAWDGFGGSSAGEKITHYLATEDIVVHDVDIEDLSDNNGVVCLACTCGTGRIIYVLIEEEDLGKAENLGFEKN